MITGIVRGLAGGSRVAAPSGGEEARGSEVRVGSASSGVAGEIGVDPGAKSPDQYDRSTPREAGLTVPSTMRTNPGWFPDLRTATRAWTPEADRSCYLFRRVGLRRPAAPPGRHSLSRRCPAGCHRSGAFGVRRLSCEEEDAGWRRSIVFRPVAENEDSAPVPAHSPSSGSSNPSSCSYSQPSSVSRRQSWPAPGVL